MCGSSAAATPRAGRLLPPDQHQAAREAGTALCLQMRTRGCGRGGAGPPLHGQCKPELTCGLKQQQPQQSLMDPRMKSLLRGSAQENAFS